MTTVSTVQQSREITRERIESALSSIKLDLDAFDVQDV